MAFYLSEIVWLFLIVWSVKKLKQAKILERFLMFQWMMSCLESVWISIKKCNVRKYPALLYITVKKHNIVIDIKVSHDPRLDHKIHIFRAILYIWLVLPFYTEKLWFPMHAMYIRRILLFSSHDLKFRYAIGNFYEFCTLITKECQLPEPD